MFCDLFVIQNKITMCTMCLKHYLIAYYVMERPVDFQGGGGLVFFGKNISALIFAQKNISGQSWWKKIQPLPQKKIIYPFLMQTKMSAWSLNGKTISTLFICKKMSVWILMLWYHDIIVSSYLCVCNVRDYLWRHLGHSQGPVTGLVVYLPRPERNVL